MNAVKSLFSKYLAHLVGYVVAGAAVVSQLDPKALPPVGVLAIGVAGLITTAAHHGYAAGTGVAAAQAAVNAVSTALAAAKPAALGLLLALMLVGVGGAGLTGCASVQSFLGSPTGTEVVAASVDIAVATAEAKGISAVQINTIAKAALAADSGTAATLAAVSGVVQSELAALKLPVADQAAADILVAALSAAIQAKVGTNTTLATAQADAAVVLAAVVAATGG